MQRQTADLKAAGLNPMMMYGGGAGGGASTPSSGGVSSAAASSKTSEPQLTPPSSALAQMTMERARLKIISDKTNAEIGLIKEKAKTEESVRAKNKAALGPVIKGYETYKLLKKPLKKNYQKRKEYDKKWRGKKIPITRKKKK